MAATLTPDTPIAAGTGVGVKRTIKEYGVDWARTVTGKDSDHIPGKSADHFHSQLLDKWKCWQLFTEATCVVNI